MKMTEVEKKSGIYESNDGNDVIVDGKKYPITIPVANWIRDKKYQSGLNVTFEIKEQHRGRDRADLMEKIRGLETEISEVKRYVEQSYLERKQSAAVARDVSNAQAHEIIKMQDRINGLEHRLGLAQDRIAEIHPSGCVPHVKSKPKSRLKTDRVKKVK